MSIKVAIHHHTEYRYDRLVYLSPQLVRLRPAPHSRTPVLSYSLKVEPSKHFINWQQDPFGNHLAHLVFPERVRRLTLDVDVIVDMTVINPFDFFLDEGYGEFPFQYPAELAGQLEPYLHIAEAGPRFKDWLTKVPRTPQATVSFLVDLNRRVQRDIDYLIRFEPGVQSSEETLARASGSCRDSAWLLVDVLRHLGLAARFVSGYLVQLTPDQKPVEGWPGPSQDFTDLHAWAEAYVPGAGWLGLDPTSGLFAGEGHIPLACAPDPTSAAPVTGLTEPCETEFSYHNRVRRLPEDARVTKPYTDAQWQAILALGSVWIPT
jgi:transglutaminase-like putative cysteine protease